MTTEATLDELYRLQQQRIQEINRKGVNFVIGLGSSDYKGHVVSSTQINFHAGAPVRPGHLITAESGAVYLVKASTGLAGRTEVTVAAATTHLTVFQHHNKGKHPITKQDQIAYSLSKSNVPAAFDRDQGAFIVSAGSAPAVGDLIKSSGPDTWRVTSVLFSSGIAYVNVEEYHNPRDTTQKYADAYDKRFAVGKQNRHDAFLVPAFR